MLPDRIQLSRRRGYRMPPRTRVCDRRTAYGNPFRVGERFNNLALWIAITDILTMTNLKQWHTEGGFIVENATQAVMLFRKYANWLVYESAGGRELLDALRAYDHLGCFCALDAPCHVDVWLEMLKERT